MNDLSARLDRLSPARVAALMRRLEENEAGGGSAAGIRRVTGTAPAPLSFAQERLWFLQQVDPGNPAYNAVAAARIEGALDARALQRAVDMVVERHDVLRSRFRLVNGAPVQEAVAGMRVPVVMEDLRELPASSVAAATVDRRPLPRALSDLCTRRSPTTREASQSSNSPSPSVRAT